MTDSRSVAGYKGQTIGYEILNALNCQSSEILAALAKAFEGYSNEERKAQIKKVCRALINIFY